MLSSRHPSDRSFKGRVQKTRPCLFTGQGIGQPALPSEITQEFARAVQTGSGAGLLWFGPKTNQAIPNAPEHAGTRPRLSVPS